MMMMIVIIIVLLLNYSILQHVITVLQYLCSLVLLYIIYIFSFNVECMACKPLSENLKPPVPIV